MDAVVVDINRFHIINERYGRAYADQLLRRIPKRVLAPGEMEKVILRPADLPAEGGSIRFCIEEGTN